MDFGRIAFGVRCGGADPVFFQSWTHFLCAGKDRGGLRAGDAVLTPSVELPHHWAANVLVNQFMKHTECDTLMLLDDDMQFEPNNVSALRDHKENHSFDIVQALCCSRKAPHAPIMLADTGDGRYIPLKPTKTCKTHPVGMVGLAFTIIRRSAFEAIQPTLDAPGMYFAWGGNGLGEDATFCQLAKAADVKIGVDARVSISHRCTVGIEFDIEDSTTKMHAYQNPGFMDLLAGLDEHKQGEK
jgi:hypothetical protein